jgi:hypothetical protein
MGSPYMNEMQLSGYNSYGGNMYGDHMYGGAGRGFYRSPHGLPPTSRYMREPYMGSTYGGHYDDMYDDGLYPGHLRYVVPPVCPLSPN